MIMESRQALVEYFEQGCTPHAERMVGVEHEKLVFDADTLEPLRYRENGRDICALLDGFRRFDWQPEYEREHLIGLSRADGSAISLEPAGQLELADAPRPSLERAFAAIETHADEAGQAAGGIGAGVLSIGFEPAWSLADMPSVPKSRFGIMRRYMPKRGSSGLDMMHRTCSVQVNLDFADETDMVRKFRVALALQPVAIALCACSPFRAGKPDPHLSCRSHTWLDTDPDRTGMLPFVFDEGMGFERYVEYALDVPMYSVSRHGRHIDTTGQSFRDFLDGRLPALPGEWPTRADWLAHLQAIMPEVRLKRHLELRGADAGSLDDIRALCAFWVGLLYDGGALAQAEALVRGWSAEEREQLRRDAPRLGLRTPFRGRPLAGVAAEAVAVSRAGLAAGADRQGADGTRYLEAFERTLDSGRTPAERMLEHYHGEWGGSVVPLFREYAQRSDACQ